MLRIQFYFLVLCGAAIALGQASGESLDIEGHQRLLQLRHLAVEFIDYYGNITIRDVQSPAAELPNQQDLQCMAEIAMLSQGLKDGSLWALRSK